MARTRTHKAVLTRTRLREAVQTHLPCHANLHVRTGIPLTGACACVFAVCAAGRPRVHSTSAHTARESGSCS